MSRTVVEGPLRGQSQNQIATALGVSEGTVSRRKAEAIRQLRNMLCAAQPRQVTRVDPAGDASAARHAACRPVVTIQYQTTIGSRIVLQRHYRWCACGCLYEGDVDLTWIRRGEQQTSRQMPGTCNFFLPEDVDDEFVGEPGSKTSFHAVLIPPEYFEHVAESEGVRGVRDMRPRFGFRDRAVEDMILSMRRHRNDRDDLAEECEGRSLVIGLAELHGFGTPERLRDESVLTAGETRKLREYVDEHLHGRIALRQLAQVLGLSQGHFNRKATGSGSGRQAG